MNREFLDLYNRELQLLNEQAREFADEYPGIAERLGGILEDRVDPMIGGLLEGAAFLAARVQLKRNLLAEAVAQIGDTFLEKSGAVEGETAH